MFRYLNIEFLRPFRYFTIIKVEFVSKVSAMKVAQRIAETLRSAKHERKMTTAELERRTGLTAVSIRAALSGVKDSKLSTVIAIAHELELDLVLVPKAVSASLASPAIPAPQVKTLADSVRERVLSSGPAK